MRHRIPRIERNLCSRSLISFWQVGIVALLVVSVLVPPGPPIPPTSIDIWPDASEARTTGVAGESPPSVPVLKEDWWDPEPVAPDRNQDVTPLIVPKQMRPADKIWPNIGLPYDLHGKAVVRSAGTAEIDDVADWARIVYESYRDGNWEIYTTDGAGHAAARLTNHPAKDILPVLDRGAKHIAFASDRDRNDRYEIYTVDVDGDNLRRLTHNDVTDSQPAWSPDGKKIAFISMRDGNAEIYVMNADGSGETRITNNSQIDFSPCWSPDGRYIVWVRRQGEYDGILMRANIDGSGAHTLGSSMRFLQHPSYAPDGSWIAFDADLNSDWWNDLGRMSMTDGNRTIEHIRTAGTAHELWLGNWSPEAEPFSGHTKLLITQLDYELHSDGYYYLSDLALQLVSVSGNVIGTLPDTGLDARPNIESEDIWPPEKPFIAPFEPFTSLNDQPTIGWDVDDIGEAGVIMYGCQEWQADDGDPHEMETTDDVMSMGAAAGDHYSVRVQAQDAAGQWSPWSDTRSTIAYTWRVRGAVRDNNDIALSNIQVGLFPEGLESIRSGADGAYLGRLVNVGQHRLSISSPLYTLATPSFNRLINNHTAAELSFVPNDNVIRNGSFEKLPYLSDWSQMGNTNINVDAHDGKLCAQMTLPEAPMSPMESVLRQNLNVSAALHRPTLAFFYRFDPGKADDTSFIVALTSSVSVTTSDAPTETVLISTTQAAPDWTYATLDLSDWSGKNVDLTFRLAGQAGDAISKVLLDRISLGSWKTPVPDAISPFHVDESGPLTVTVTISGQNFIDPPTVFLGNHQLTDVVQKSSTAISATLTPGMAPGIYDLRVQNPGGYTSTRQSAFHVGKQVYLPIMQVD